MLGDCIRHRSRHSIGLQIGKLFLSEFLKSSYNSSWRVGNNINMCTLCGRCEMICPVNAISVSIPKKSWILNNRHCIHCLKCIMTCPVHCLNKVNL